MKFLPLVGSVGLFILLANWPGLVPGLMAPTSNINVTVGRALTAWIYYHIQGVRAQGIVSYLKHFAAPPGAPVWIAPIMLPIEIISHISRVLSLSLRLLRQHLRRGARHRDSIQHRAAVRTAAPMMFLGLVTGGLQAFIFVLLTTIYFSLMLPHRDHEEGHEVGGKKSH